MRCLARDKSTVWASLYEESVEVLDEDGKRTGYHETVRSDPFEIDASVSAARGSVYEDGFGQSVNYDRSVLIEDVDTPVSESTVFWIDADPATDEWDYKVSAIARTPNVVKVAVKRREVSK